MQTVEPDSEARVTEQCEKASCLFSGAIAVYTLDTDLQDSGEVTDNR